MIVKLSPILFRYDLDEPPSEWSSTFFNKEKNYNDPILGHKNKAGLFFFTDSSEIVKNLGKTASIINSKNKYFITTIQLETCPEIIDFSNCKDIYSMIYVLESLKIDVLIEDIKTNDGIHNMKELRSNYEAKNKELLRIHTSKTIDYRAIGPFGQMLTDYDNGFIFKELVKSKYPHIAGYRWNEFDHNKGFTYCFFESETLPDYKKVETISLLDEYSQLLAT